MNEKLAHFLEIIECENTDGITANTLLSDIEEWDSMGVISAITMLATDYGYTMTYEELKKVKKVGDILALME